jgi:L,D-peptidoglycan transpeptidase YkuD (ErfK/YbiS/YcfS/YnhG family)
VRIEVTADRLLAWTERRVPCALGRGGIRPDKREGDGATPVGCFPLRRVLYRPDRLPLPETRLPVQPIGEDDGWCDDPADPAYNRPVKLPYAASHERMWREDDLYDLVVVLGHNDDPPARGAGSAIFLHLARPDYGPTEGCIALRREHLLELLGDCGPDSLLCVSGHIP